MSIRRPSSATHHLGIAIGTLVLVMASVTGAAAQHDAHAAQENGKPAAPMAGMPGMQGMSCMSGGQDMRALVDGMAAEVEKARQANSPAAMRAALETAQSGLAKLREHMASCQANMAKMHAGGAGMDHSAHGAASGSSADHSAHAGGTPAPAQAPAARAEEAKQAWTIEITATGYEPASITVKAGVKATLTFIRKIENTCGTEVVFPDYDIEKDLPLNKPVVVEITPSKTGEFRFTCGMNMFNGKMVVR